MADPDFLRECGIEVDARWLIEHMPEVPQELYNYAQCLLRIADILSGCGLSPAPSPPSKS